MTLPLFISEPVAGSVNTLPNGIASRTSACFSRMSHGSPPNFSAAAINFVPSMTEPPPTASRKSMFFSRAIATACIKVVGWIRLDPAEHEPCTLSQRRLHLGGHTIALDAAATRRNQPSGIVWNFCIQRGDLSFAEDDLGWIAEGKVLHDVLLLNACGIGRQKLMMSCRQQLFNGRT
jgi:hypothetical protein